MRKSMILVVCLVILSALLLSGCKRPSSSVLRPSVTASEQYDMSAVMTVGNYSFIPLNINGYPSDNVGKILGALNAFEKAHPELDVVPWHIENQQVAYLRSSQTFGIWVFHRPKK